MKLTRNEKIWLAVVAGFYILYNLPWVPRYGNAAGALVHGVLTLVPLWVAVFFGMFRMFREFPLRDKEDR